ncbi:MAG TPA: DUF1761 domain-containing protein [Niastella sp.]|nr:DUF1761 domain-containing protein [Niastella sp.]
MTMPLINWWAVLVAGISSFVVGGIWYSPGLFGKAWMKDNSFTEEQIRKGGNKEKIFGFTLIFSLLMSVNLAMFLAAPADCPPQCVAKTDITWGAIAGFLAGIWTFCAIAIHSLFEFKPWRLICINGFYSIVALILMGAIIGAWR